MSRATRKRTPRQVRDPMEWILKRTPLRADQQTDIGLAYHLSLSAMTKGHGTEEAWSTLACAINTALVLAEQGNLAAAEPEIKLAQAALVRSRERAQRTGKWAFDGDGMRDVMRAFALHDQQVESTTKGAISSALNEVYRRVKIGEVFA